MPVLSDNDSENDECDVSTQEGEEDIYVGSSNEEWTKTEESLKKIFGGKHDARVMHAE